jgi:hypothetical protein
VLIPNASVAKISTRKQGVAHPALANPRPPPQAHPDQQHDHEDVVHCGDGIHTFLWTGGTK